MIIIVKYSDLEARENKGKLGDNCSSVGRVMVDLIQRSWVRFPLLGIASKI